MKKIYNILLALFTIIPKIGFSQEQIGKWVEYESEVPVSRWYLAAGENCALYAPQDTNLIIAYDIHSHAWYEHQESINRHWRRSKAGADVVATWDDSIIVAFSAIHHSFHSIQYEGDNICSDNCGADQSLFYYVTETGFYVFNSEQAQWYIYEISLPAASEDISAGIYINDDYIACNLHNWKTKDWYSIILFSKYTGTFTQFSHSKMKKHYLDHGMVIFNNDDPYGQPENYYFAGYSVFTGEIDTINVGHYFYDVNTSYDAPDFHPRNVYQFFYGVLDNGSHYTGYMYVFDTIDGKFHLLKFGYSNASNGGIGLFDSWNGSEISIRAVHSWDDDDLSYFIYDGWNHYFFETESPLERFTGRPHVCGGRIFSGWDKNTLMSYDVINKQYASIEMPSSPPYFNNKINARVSKRWAAMTCKQYDTDSLTLYSYNTETNQFQSIGDNTPYGNIYGVGIDFKENIGIINVQYTAESGNFYIYMPGDNRWKSQLYNEKDPFYGLQEDFGYIYSTNSKDLTIYCGATGSETIFPYGWDITYNAYNNLFSSDDFLVIRTPENKYYGYSFSNDNVSEYEAQEDYQPQNGEGSILVMGHDYSFLTYNAIQNCFISLQLLEEDGEENNLQVGGKTAILTTRKGKVFVFDPYIVDTEIQHKNIFATPIHFELFQNYPNPFNSSTKIKFSIPKRSNISINIFDINGTKVQTLSKGLHEKGTYKITWDGTDFQGKEISSGIYYIKMQANNYVQVKKMIHLK